MDNLQALLQKAAGRPGSERLHRLKAWIESGNFAFYGGGQTAAIILDKLSDTGIRPAIIIDDTPSKKGSLMSGVPVAPLDEASSEQSKDLCIIITMMNARASYLQLRERLQAKGFSNVFSFLELFQLFQDRFLPYYQFAAAADLLQDTDRIESAYELFTDDHSKQVFLGNLDYRLNMNFDDLPKADHEYYFPDALFPESKVNAVYVDCGAFDGDTLEKFLAKETGVYRIYAFEPDPKNFSSLLSYVSGLDAAIRNKIYLFNCGISKQHGYLRFSAFNNMGSFISEEGTMVIQTVAFDDPLMYSTFEKDKTIYLKMDIEGEERQALEGAARFIQSFAPSLAISIYHCPDDLWTIPIYLKSIQPAYQFYLRQHGHDGMDLVLYARTN